MDRLLGVVLLAGVCVLLIVVASAVESGKVSGADYNGTVPLKGIGFGWVGGGSRNNQTGGGSGSKTNQTGGPTPPLTVGISFIPGFPGVPTWLLALAAVVLLGGASLIVLRTKPSTNVVDLDETLREMEEQRKEMERTWSYKLRNAALLRYYILMRKACVAIGIRDEVSETPQEYVGRASSELKVDGSDAALFASAVNRSRYGEELSPDEAKEVSAFMSGFADVIRRAAGGKQ